MTLLALATRGLLCCLGCAGENDSATPWTDPPQDLTVSAPVTVDVVDTGGYAEGVTVELPAGASSALLWCGPFGDPVLGSLWGLTGPSGQVFDNDTADQWAFRASWLDDLVPAVFPVHPDHPPDAGTWTGRFWIGRGHPGQVDCGSVVRSSSTGDEVTVPVEIVIVGLDVLDPPLDASTAPDDADLQAALAQLVAEWASAGLTPQFRYRDHDGDPVVEISDDDTSRFNDLLRTTDPDQPKLLSVFLVEEIVNTSQGGATILGLSAGPPGAAGLHGTSKSGMIVTAADLRSDAASVGKILAHEGGHFLGLNHTSEKDGARHDPLDDTPECRTEDDADANGVVNTAECAGKGAENVMWWTLTSGTASFSADQGWVARRNPVNF